ncbi:hypothetical protein ACTA71_003884 [Dictyostelium dimigraforme]
MDPTRYWYYIITPSRYEIKLLVQLNGLGFKRFQLLYKEFNILFQRLKYSLLKEFNWYNLEFLKLNCGGNINLFKLVIENHYTEVLNDWNNGKKENNGDQNYLNFIINSIYQNGNQHLMAYDGNLSIINNNLQSIKFYSTKILMYYTSTTINSK